MTRNAGCPTADPPAARWGRLVPTRADLGFVAIWLAVFAAGKRTYADEKAARQNRSPEERRQGIEMLLFIFGIYGLFALYLAFDQFLLPRLPNWFPELGKEGTRATQATAIGSAASNCCSAT